MKKTVLGGILTAAAFVSCTTTVVVPTEQFVGNWIEVTPADPFTTHGITLAENGAAASFGDGSTMSLEGWQIADGYKIVLNGKSPVSGKPTDFSDTLQIVKVTPDTLILSYRVVTGAVNYFDRTFVRSSVAPDSIKQFDPTDSLSVKPDLGEVGTRLFHGVLPAADCPGIDYKLWIYNQPKSGDGVYKLTMIYLEGENGRDVSYTSFGRVYTLRGDATDKNATVYQLQRFGNADDITNYLYTDSGLEMLNREFQRAESGMNYTLKLQK